MRSRLEVRKKGHLMKLTAAFRITIITWKRKLSKIAAFWIFMWVR